MVHLSPERGEVNHASRQTASAFFNALLVAFSISPGTAAMTGLLFLGIQQLEGNVLTPRIQAQTIKVPSILIFLGVIAGGALAGLLGVLLAVPTLATCRVVFDFFHARLVVAPRVPP